MRIANKRTIITGGASGIGRAGAELFAREGATVAIIDIDGAALDATTDAIKAAGGRVVGIRADLADRAACRASIGEAIERLGGIDILWLHAGVAVAGDFDALDLERYDQATELNVTSPIMSIGVALGHMREQGNGGAIILTASMSGLVGSAPCPAYSVHKFGLVGMAKSLALTLGKDGIRINALCPGYVRTAAMIDYLEQAHGPAAVASCIAELAADVPLGRVAEPEDIARAALWLASDDAAYVTGIALPIDGGFTAK